MYGQLGLPRTWVPTGLTRKREPLLSGASPRKPGAIGFGWAVALATTTMVVGASLIATVPFAVMALATVVGSGLIAGVLVEAGDQWLAARRSKLRL
jgi:hypothetical protein